jgi:hypothetical protein
MTTHFVAITGNYYNLLNQQHFLMDLKLKLDGYKSAALPAGISLTLLLAGCGSLSPSHQEQTFTHPQKLITSNPPTAISKILPPQAMSVGEITSLDPKGKDCDNQVAWERLMNNQIQMRGLEGKNPEDMTPEDREFNAGAHQILWSLRIHCSASKKAK